MTGHAGRTAQVGRQAVLESFKMLGYQPTAGAKWCRIGFPGFWLLSWSGLDVGKGASRRLFSSRRHWISELGKEIKLERDQGESGNEWIITQPIDSCRAIAVWNFDFCSTRVLGNRLVLPA